MTVGIALTLSLHLLLSSVGIKKKFKKKLKRQQFTRRPLTGSKISACIKRWILLGQRETHQLDTDIFLSTASRERKWLLALELGNTLCPSY